jgi:hypothetical protein
MRAIAASRFGGNDVLELTEVQTPSWGLLVALDPRMRR